MKKMKDLPVVDRPREKIASRGAAALSDTELIEAILGRGTKNRDVRSLARDLSAVIAEKHGEVTLSELDAIEGIGPTKAAQVLACLELGRRCYGLQAEAARIQKPEDVLPLVTEFRDRHQEHFICISLNGAGEVIGKRVVTIGLLNHSLVHPREVFADAITDRAASVICVHNHPSGSLEPSSQDIAITRQLAESGVLLGIRLLDHVIISRTGFCSMKERGLV
ncbi:MAG: DNA repair protein RadC [Methanoregula sp.]|jgi:DNA repair protein RadC